jgi:hypothetical protein
METDTPAAAEEPILVDSAWLFKQSVLLILWFFNKYLVAD